MRRLAALLFPALLPGIAAAGCNTEAAAVVRWSITPVDADTNRLETALVWQGEAAVRMVDGSVQFADVLGGRIASFALKRDRVLNPGETFAESGLWGKHTFERLLEMKPEDVVTRVCIRGVVTDAGEIVKY